MFTGIIEERGAVRTSGRRLVVEAGMILEDVTPGASMAVNGVCQTVVDVGRDGDDRGALSFDLSAETLDRTSLGRLRPGVPVNLERPVTLLTRMGGHLVQGHVDGVGTVREVQGDEADRRVAIEVSPSLGRYVVEKGSVAVDG